MSTYCRVFPTPSARHRLVMRPLCCRLLACGLLLAAAVPAVQAGALTDGSVGPARTALSGNFTVPPSLGSTRGTNLFQSFQRFSIDRGESATFQSTDAAVRNVIVRVTGGEITQIDGPLKLTAPVGAKPGLWFMNPSGIAVGSAGSFDVPGSLRLSTAPGLQFADGSSWSTSAANGSTLSVADPRAFGFVVAVQAAPLIWTGRGAGESAVKSGGEVELSAGSISLAGAVIKTTAGGITLAASGDINVTQGSELSASYRADVAGNGYNIALNGSQVTVSDSQITSSTDGPTGTRGGGIGITAVRGFSLLGDSLLGVYADRAGDAGSVRINAAEIRLVGTEDFATAAIEAYGYGDNASAGEVRLTSGGAVTLRDGGYISVGTLGSGGSGRIDIGAASLFITGVDSGLFGLAEKPDAEEVVGQRAKNLGSGADIGVNVSGELRVEDGGWISSDTATPQKGGTITLRAGSMRLSDFGSVQSNSNGDGAGGNIDIKVSGTLTIESNAYVSADTTGRGDGGSIKLGDEKTAALLLNNAKVSANTSGDGAAGRITLQGDTVSLRNQSSVESQSTGLGASGVIEIGGRQISVNASKLITDSGRTTAGTAGEIVLGNANTTLLNLDGGSEVRARTAGSAQFGNILLAADTINVAGRSIVDASTTGVGAAGDVTIEAKKGLSLSGAEVSATSSGSGAAGFIELRGDIVSLADSQVRSESTGTGETGYIAVFGRQISMASSRLNATSGKDATGLFAGYVRVGDEKTVSLTLSAGSEVLTLTEGALTDGELRLQAETISITGGSKVDASTSGPGRAGNLSLTATTMNLTGNSKISSSAERTATADAGKVVLRIGGALTLRNAEILAFNDANYADNLPEDSGVDLRAGSLLLDRSSVLANARGGANGGTVALDIKGPTTLLNGSLIGTSAVFGDGGPVTVVSGGPLLLRQSQIFTSVTGNDFGDGGDISVQAPFIVMRSAFIQANTAVEDSKGGTVRIATGLLLPDGSNLRLGGKAIERFVSGSPAGLNVVQAAAPTGVSGQLNVTQPELNVAAALASLQAPRLGLGRLAFDLCELPGNSFLSVLTRGRLYPAASAPLAPLPIGRLE